METEIKEENKRELLRQILTLGFSKDIEGLLSFQMEWGNPQFSLRLRERYGAEEVSYRLSFFLGAEGRYHFSHYDAVLHREIIIPETVIEGIDMTALQQRMEEVDWSRDYETELGQVLHWESTEQQRFYKNIEEIFESLDGLALSRQGRPISNALKVKFFSGTPAGDFYTFDDLKALFEVERRFYLEEGKGISALEAYNVLCGRPVLKPYTDIKGTSRTGWFAIRSETENYIAPLEYLFRNQLRYRPFDLKGAIENLPIAFHLGHRYNELVRQLEQGCRIEVPMARRGEIETMYIVANPAKKTVDIFDRTGVPVSRQELLRAQPGAKPRRKSKGKSI